MKIPLFYFFLFIAFILCSTEIEKEDKEQQKENIQQEEQEEVSIEELQSLLKKLKEEFVEFDSSDQQKQKIHENVTMINAEDLTLNENYLLLFFQDKNQANKSESLQYLEKLKEALPNEIVFGLIFDEPNSRIFKKYNIQTNQKLVFFNKMKKIVFEGNLQDIIEINTWVRDSMYHSLIIIETKEDFDQFISNNKMTRILALYNESMVEQKLFLDNLVTLGVFSDTGNYVVGYSENQELIKNLEGIVVPSIILFKDYETSKPYENYTGNFTESLNLDDLLEFCHLASLPSVTTYSEETAYRIFAGPMKSQMILFIDEKENNENLIKQFQNAAQFNIEQELYYERMIYTIITSNPENQDMLLFFGMEFMKYPQIFISTLHKGQLAKFQFAQGEMISENIIEFAHQFRLQNLQRLYLSEQISGPSNKTLKKLVGQNFEQEVYRNYENYLVLFCSEIEKEQCSNHIQLFKKIAKIMNENDKKIMGIGVINPIKNELPRFMSQPYLGEILLYLKGQKTVPKEYLGEIELTKIKEFIQEKIPEIKFQDKKEVLSLGPPQKIEL